MKHYQESIEALKNAQSQAAQGNRFNALGQLEAVIKYLALDIRDITENPISQSAYDLTPVLLNREQAKAMLADLIKNGKTSTVGAIMEIQRSLGELDQDPMSARLQSIAEQSVCGVE